MPLLSNAATAADSPVQRKPGFFAGLKSNFQCNKLLLGSSFATFGVVALLYVCCYTAYSGYKWISEKVKTSQPPQSQKSSSNAVSSMVRSGFPLISAAGANSKKTQKLASSSKQGDKVKLANNGVAVQPLAPEQAPLKFRTSAL